MTHSLEIDFFAKRQDSERKPMYAAKCVGGSVECGTKSGEALTPHSVDLWMREGHGRDACHYHFQRMIIGWAKWPTTTADSPHQTVSFQYRPFTTTQDPEIRPTYAMRCVECKEKSGESFAPWGAESWGDNHVTETGHQYYKLTYTDYAVIPSPQ